jgi:hypothetical protein
MECDKFRSKLSAYKDDELAADLINEISLHVRSCTVCREELNELDRIDSLVRGMPHLDASELFASRVSAGIAATATKSTPYGITSLPRRIFTGFLQLADIVFELFPGHEYHRTATLDEFGDFPPLSLSNAYFQVIGH